LIAQLKSENFKLNDMLEKLSNERELEKKRSEKESSRAKENQSPVVDRSSANSNLKDIE